MLQFRRRDKTLFLVVDEVSQYVHQDSDRMLKLQAFVSDLGQRLKGKVWLLVTGQQKLEEGGDQSVLGKMKDRFPEKLRVHLSATNIRDVVHKRLLHKNEQGVRTLREQLGQTPHRPQAVRLRLRRLHGRGPGRGLPAACPGTST